jgi:excisionase family DNA binding protein
MLTLAEAAAVLGLAASTLRHQVQAGRLQARLIGKTYVVTAREVERYRAESLGKPGRPFSHRPAPPPGR